MSLFCYSVLTQCKVRLKENKTKCQSRRNKNVNSCQQMFNAVKRDGKKKIVVSLDLSCELHHLACSSCDR